LQWNEWTVTAVEDDDVSAGEEDGWQSGWSVDAVDDTLGSTISEPNMQEDNNVSVQMSSRDLLRDLSIEGRSNAAEDAADPTGSQFSDTHKECVARLWA
jgi:hypothetical protein